MHPTTYRLALAGLGNVGSAVLAILHRQDTTLRTRYGVHLQVTGVAELGGGAVDTAGLDLGLVLDALRTQRAVASLPGIGRPGMEAVELVQQAQAHILLEATPVNLQDAQPGLGIVTAALKQGTHAVLANKGPLTLAYDELAEMSDLGLGWGFAYAPKSDPNTQQKPKPKLRFSACVGGALPTINLGWRDLAGCQILRLEAVFNGTTQSILRAMELGQTYDEALVDAQRRGIAEADPSLDVDGWDAACKLVITANAVLGQSTKLADVHVEGIRHLTPEMVQNAVRAHQRIVLLCAAELSGARYRLSVQPTALPLDHPLSRLTSDEMGVVYYADAVDRLSAASSEPGASPAAAAMVRDVLDIVRSEIGT